MDAVDTFRWQALFQKSRDPIFVLSRSRRILFVNRAWEMVTGIAASDARGLTCTRRMASNPLAAIGRALSPPQSVMKGHSSRTRRPPPGAAHGPPWWDIEFLPLSDESQVIGILGRITVHGAAPAPGVGLIPGAWAAIRAQAADQDRIDLIDSTHQPTLSAQIQLAAGSRCPVYIVGESGTGKRAIARAIHFGSAERDRAFVGLDCEFLPQPALREVLLGPVGFRRAEWQGTVYLNEPAALPRELQHELCQRLAEELPLGPRMICGSIEAEDPKRPVFLGQMLPEFYDALSVLVIPVAPLRARREELPLLVDGMLKRVSLALGRVIGSLSASAWECLRAYAWPGNMRELYDVLLRAGRRASADSIDAGDLPLAVRQSVVAAESRVTASPPPIPPLDKLLEEVERRMIQTALDRAQGNQSKAAELLGVWRPRLIRRIKALGLK